MKSLEVTRKIEAEELQRIFGEVIGNMTFAKVYRSGETESTIMGGSKYFLRTNDTIGFVFSSFYDGRSLKLDFGRLGGGSGLFNIRLGAGNKLEQQLVDLIRQSAESTGAQVTESE